MAGAARYVAFFETMTPAALDDGLDAVASPDIHFVDPFNDVTGVAALRRILRAMYGDTRDPRFVVTHRAFDGDVCFLRWRFTAGVPALRADLEIVGMTELRFAADGRVCEHVDHWDAAGQMYERVPGLGWVLRRLRRRLGHG
nr:nuclear transport factor 2 family protein [Roseospira goensis]